MIEGVMIKNPYDLSTRSPRAATEEYVSLGVAFGLFALWLIIAFVLLMTPLLLSEHIWWQRAPKGTFIAFGSHLVALIILIALAASTFALFAAPFFLVLFTKLLKARPEALEDGGFLQGIRSQSFRRLSIRVMMITMPIILLSFTCSALDEICITNNGIWIQDYPWNKSTLYPWYSVERISVYCHRQYSKNDPSIWQFGYTAQLNGHGDVDIWDDDIPPSRMDKVTLLKKALRQFHGEFDLEHIEAGCRPPNLAS